MEIKNFSKDNKSKNVAISDSESNEVKKNHIMLNMIHQQSKKI